MSTFTLSNFKGWLFTLLGVIAFSTMTWSQCDDLFFTQYIEGSGNNKCLEFYNPTDNTITLDNYQIRIYSNGAVIPNVVIGWIASSPGGNMLAAGETFVICNPGQALGITPDRSTGSINFNGNDAITLNNLGSVIDAIGQVGNATNFGSDVHWVRKSSITQGDTDADNDFSFAGSGEWDAGPADNGAGFGSHTLDEGTCDTGGGGDCPTDANVFINEFHYDNFGSDVDEFVEIAVANSFTGDLSTITLTLYNGFDGAPYGSPHLLSSFDVGNNDGTYTYYTKFISGIQNGPDGFSLHCNNDPAYQFLSYEGEITATAGPAMDQTSTDVGVSETGSTDPGSSIQLIDGTWELTLAFNTAGDTNAFPPEGNCMISNVTVTAEGGCDGADATFSVTFDVVDGSGQYELYDVNDPSIVYDDFLSGGAQGNFFLNGVVPGPVDAQTLMVSVRDINVDGCSGNVVEVDLQDCPIEVVCPGVGDLVITEIIQNPSAVFDSQGEWFEVYNATGTDIDMKGFVIRDFDSDNHTISDNLIVPANGYVVLGNNIDMNTNGGAPVDYEYAGFNLSNGADEVVIECNGTVIDQVAYDGGPIFPDPNGASMSLDPDFTDHISNDDGANWCEATTPYGNGDLGTPGAQNTECCAGPDAVCMDATVELDSDGNATVTVADIDAGSTAECGFGNVVVSPSSFDCSETGSNSISLIVIDVNGAVSTCTASVTVNDSEAPEAVCIDNTVFIQPDGSYTLTEDDVLNFAASSDNCGFYVTGIDPYEVDCNDFGTTVDVLVTISDDAGNPDNCTAHIYVDKGSALPAPWQACSVGPQGTSETYDPCEEYFEASTYGTSYPKKDALSSIYQSVCGNFELIANIKDLYNAGWGGLEARESCAQGAKKVGIKTQVGYFIWREARTSTNGYKISQKMYRPGNHDWLRLIRNGNTFVGYTSANGQTWQFAMAFTMPINSCLQVGLFAEGKNNNTLTSALFQYVSLSTNAPLVGPEVSSNIDMSNEFVDGQELGLYPNPAVDEVNIDLDSYTGEEVQIRIFNNLGQQVRQLHIDEVQHSVETIRVHDLENGTYLMQVRSDTRESAEKFIISGK